MAGKLVVGRFNRCESATPYLAEALPHKELLLPRVYRQDYRKLVETNQDQNPGTVILFSIWYQMKLGYDRPLGHPMEFQAESGWIDIGEIGRYWWTGPMEFCESLRPHTPMELWVHAPCCDVLPGTGPCLADLRYAEPIPPDIRKQLSDVLSQRPRIPHEDAKLPGKRLDP
jgi:hypothetical protein